MLALVVIWGAVGQPTLRLASPSVRRSAIRLRVHAARRDHFHGTWLVCRPTPIPSSAPALMQNARAALNFHVVCGMGESFSSLARIVADRADTFIASAGCRASLHNPSLHRKACVSGGFSCCALTGKDHGPRLRCRLSLQNKGSAADFRDVFEKNLCRWYASARRKPWRNEKDFRGIPAACGLCPAGRFCMEMMRLVHKYDVRHALARFLYGFLDESDFLPPVASR